jgi:hypothetical protein
MAFLAENDPHQQSIKGIDVQRFRFGRRAERIGHWPPMLRKNADVIELFAGNEIRGVESGKCGVASSRESRPAADNGGVRLRHPREMDPNPSVRFIDRTRENHP